MRISDLFLLIIALSFGSVSTSTFAQAVDPPPHWRVIGASADLAFAAGDLPSAVRIGRDALKHAYQENYSAAYEAASVLTEWCLQGGDNKCAVEFEKEAYEALKLTADEIQRSERGRRNFFATAARSLRLAIGLGNTEVINLWEKPLEKFVLSNPSYGELLFVDANLALAELFVERKEFKRAEFYAERGWASLLTGRFVAPAGLLAIIPRFYLVFKSLGQGQRAANIALVASPLLFNAAGSNAYGALSFAVVMRDANAQIGHVKGAIDFGLAALREIDRIALPEHRRAWILELIETELIFDCIRAQLQQCGVINEIAKRRTEEIVRRWNEGGEARSRVANLSLSSALVMLAAGQDIPAEVNEALIHQSIGENANDSNGAQLAKTAGRFLRSLSERNLDDAARYGAEGARALLRIRREAIARQPLDIAPIDSNEALVLSLVVAGTFTQLSAQGLSDDELLQIADQVKKSGRNLDGQYMQALSAAPSQAAAASLQAMHRLQQDMHLFERRLLADRVKIALGPSISESAERWDHPTLRRMERNFKRFDELRLTSQGILSSAGLTSLNALQGILQDEERYLTHFVTGGRLATLCVSKAKVWKALTTFDANRVITDIKILRAALSNPTPPSQEIDSTFPVKRAASLTEVFLSPVSECLRGAKHLNVTFDEGLSGIPPNVLLDPLANIAAFHDVPKEAPWLGFRYAIAVVSSSQQLIAARKLSRSTLTGRKFLGVGDPLLEGLTTDGVSRGKAVMRGASSSIPRNISELGQLPETAEELSALATAFGASSKLMLRDQASERAVRRLHLKEYGTLSFATHGLVREEIPGLTEPALVLTPMVASEDADDGLLTATEISRLELAANLVILSACNSAQFDLALFGPEAASLSSAFFLAGARATLASLWSVNSEATTKLMSEFGRAYAGREGGASEAMRIAFQRFVRTAGLPSGFDHPRYWAAFLVHGDGAASVPYKSALPATHANVIDIIGNERGNLSSIVSNGKEAYVTGARPQRAREVYEGFIRRLAPDGQVLWEKTSRDEFFSVVTRASREGVYILRHSNPEASSRKLSVSLLDWKGTESRTVEVPLGPATTLAGKGVEIGPGQVAIPFAELGAEGERKPFNSVWVVDVFAGKVVHQWIVPTPIGNSSRISLVAASRGSYIASVTDQGFVHSLEGESPRVSAWGLFELCTMRVGTRIFAVDTKRSEPVSVWSYSGVGVVDAQPRGDGSLAFALEIFDPCDTQPIQVAVAVWREGRSEEMKPITVGGFKISAHALRRIGSELLLLGSVRREFDNANFESASPTTDLSYLTAGRIRNDLQHGAIAIRLNESLETTSTEMVITGMDNFAEDASVLGNYILVVGATSDSQFAFRLPFQ